MPKTPSRRSARLAAAEATSPSFTSKLGSLLERVETPNNNASLDAITSPNKKMPGAFDNSDDESNLKTPETAGRLHPARADMHPSKTQQSTTKAPDSGLRLGFTNIDESANSASKAIESTPSKSTFPVSPRFNFQWKSPEADLSSEAQRIMESVRVEASKIKEKMRFERDQQALKDAEAGEMGYGRKIAKPKSRFSDAHKAEFKKMDSIASHVSVWKHKLQKSTSAVNLKRTKSKSSLREGDSTSVEEPDNLDNRGGKRMKTRIGDDTSSHPPTSSAVSGFATPKRSVTTFSAKDGFRTTHLPAAAKTPTRASAARSASVKSLRTAKPQTPGRSRSSVALEPNAPPKTEGNNKYFNALSRAPSMKSILRRSPSKFFGDAAKTAIGKQSPSAKGMNLDKALPSIPPSIANNPVLQQSPTVKRVGFKLDAITHNISSSASSSPSKIPGRINSAPASPSKSAGNRTKDPVVYPTLPKHVPGPLSSHPPGPGDFTFRSNKTIQFGYGGAAPVKQPTIRHVRPSGVATPVLPSVPHGVPNKKRRRADSDDEEDRDNTNVPEEKARSPAKKMKRDGGVLGIVTPKKKIFGSGSASAGAKTPGSKTPGSKKKGLSLARLNMLARPKQRG